MGIKRRVWLVHRGVWTMNLRSMPLALGYLKAAAEADPVVRRETDIRIFAFDGKDTPSQMIHAMLAEGAPDVIGFSVYGWNSRQFGVMTETFRALNPDVWILWGGPHVSGERVMRLHPGVDVVIDGEGETTFCQLIAAYLAGDRHNLSAINGLTYRDPQQGVVKTAPASRIMNLDAIPSPLLTGALQLRDTSGRQLYDVALMETNRGCPYKCAFCYWGGAIGQKVRAFSRERLRDELELIARQDIATVCLCDANFGMLKQDADFLDDVIAMRSKHGFPRSLETSWAKNKGPLFYGIVRRMKEAGLRSSFTLALQSLSDDALDLMQRRNMKVNAFEDLAAWLAAEGMDAYAELIWGMPGETCESFFEGYDRIAGCVSRIATYPHLILPNTSFDRDREKLSLVTLRGVDDDFEYVFSHATMTFEENLRVQRFLFWSRLVAEHGVLRFIWTPLRVVARVSQSEALRSLDAWMSKQQDEAALKLIGYREDFALSLQGARLEPALQYVHVTPGIRELFEQWWLTDMLPRVPDGDRPLFAELFRYDWLRRPLHEASPEAKDLERERLLDTDYFVRRPVDLTCDVPAWLAAIRDGSAESVAAHHRSPVALDAIYYRVGYSDYLLNHEFVVHFAGKTKTEILGELAGEQTASLDAGYVTTESVI